MNYQRILLIDDDPDDQELFAEAVKELDPTLDCQVYDSAIRALEALKNRDLLCDLIFLDLNMPLMNGQQFLQEVKHSEGLKDIPVIIMSTTSNRRMLDETAALGAKAYHTKPDSYEKLVILLAQILNTPE